MEVTDVISGVTIIDEGDVFSDIAIDFVLDAVEIPLAVTVSETHFSGEFSLVIDFVDGEGDGAFTDGMSISTDVSDGDVEGKEDEEFNWIDLPEGAKEACETAKLAGVSN